MGDGRLTRREVQILALLADGQPTETIGRRLGISTNTVKTHLTSVYAKTGAHNRVQAARHYLDHYLGAARPASTDRRPPALIQRQILELEARLEQLAPVIDEAARLEHALGALRALEPPR